MGRSTGPRRIQAMKKDVSVLHLERAAVAAEIGRHTLVERECRAALASDPCCVEAYELLAWTLMEQRRYPEALSVTHAGLAVRGDRPHLHYIASVVLHRMRQLAAARGRIEQALQLAPCIALYHMRLARILVDQGARQDAVCVAYKGLSLAPEDSFVLGEAVRVLCEAGDVEQACALAAWRVRCHPDETWALAGYARALVAAGRYGEAVAAAERVIARDPNLGWIWALYAEALDALGETSRADAAIQEALRLVPTTSMGGAALARALCERGEWERAERVARAVLCREPRHPGALEVLGRLRSRGSGGRT